MEILPSLAEAMLKNRFNDNKYTIVQSLGRVKGFILLSNIDMISVMDPRYCLSEMILNNTSRFFADFDVDVIDYIDLIDKFVIGYMLDRYKVGVKLHWQYSTEDPSSSSIDRRWHCIMTGAYFNNSWIEGCRDICSKLREQFPSVAIDEGLYRTNSSLRAIGQCKLREGRYVRVMKTYVDNRLHNLLIHVRTTDKSITGKSSSDTNFFSLDRDACKVEFMNIEFVIPLGYRLGSKMKSRESTASYRLVRLYPSMCKICNRVHDSDNAYVIVHDKFVDLGCFRDSKHLLRYSR